MENALLLAQTEQAGFENATIPPAASPGVAPVLSSSTPDAALNKAVSSGGAELLAPGDSFLWSGYFEALGWLCFVLAVFCFALWLVKRRGGSVYGGSVPGMRIESRLPLGPKKWAVVVRYMDKRLVLGVTEQQITLLSEIPLGQEGGEAGQDRAFASFLKTEERTHRSSGKL